MAIASAIRCFAEQFGNIADDASAMHRIDYKFLIIIRLGNIIISDPL